MRTRILTTLTVAIVVAQAGMAAPSLAQPRQESALTPPAITKLAGHRAAARGARTGAMARTTGKVERRGDQEVSTESGALARPVTPHSGGAGTVRAAAQPPAAKPAVPFVQSVAGQGLSILAGWAPNDPSDQVASYRVLATPVSGSTSAACTAPAAANVSVTGANTSALVTGLCAAVAYTVKVSATNAVGTSSYSTASSAVVVLVAQAPKPPLVTSVVRRSGSLVVNWSPPVVTGGTPVTGYTISATAGGNTTSVTAGASDTSATIAGLANGTSYSVAVTASNSTGTSPAGTSTGTPSSAYVPGVPQAFTTSAASGSVAVSWQPPADNGGSAITGYTITYIQSTQASDGSWAPTAGATPHTLTATASATTAKATTFETAQAFYGFSIVAKNAIGTGAAATAQAPVAPVVGTTTNQVVLTADSVNALVDVTDSTLVWSSPPPSQVAAVKVGQVLTAPAGGLLPAGMLRTVTAIDTASGNYVLDTTQAALGDVFTNMSLDSALNPASSTGSAVAGARPKFLPSTSGVRVLPSAASGVSATAGVEASITLGLNKKIGNTEIAVEANLTAGVYLEINVHTHFGIPDGADVTASAKVTASVSGTVSVKGEYSTKIGELVGTPIDVQVGPVPVILLPTVPVFLTASGKIGIGVTTTAVVGGGVTWDSNNSGHLSVKNLSSAPKVSGGTVPGLTATGEVSVGLQVQPQVKIEGVAGPDVEADLDLVADVNFNPGPTDDFLTIGPKLTLKAGLDIDVFGFHKTLDVTVGAYAYAAFKIHAPPSSSYVITAPSKSVAAGSSLQLTAVRSDGGSATRTWSILDGTSKDSITSTGRLTAGTPSGRTLTVAVTDPSGASGQLAVTVGAAFDPPDPVGVTQVDNSNLGVDVTWTRPINTGGSTLASYAVITQPSTGTHTVDASVTTLHIDHLTPGTYTFAVYAINSAGTKSAPGGTSLYISPRCTATYTGPSGGDWGTAANWTPAGVPGNGDWVCLQGAAVTVASATKAVAAGLNADSSSLVVNGTVEIGTYASLNGADLSGAGTLSLDPGAAAAMPNGSASQLRLVNRGQLTLGTTTGCGCYLYLYAGAVLDNYGTTTMQDYSYISNQDGAAGSGVVNELGATLTYIGPDSASISSTLSGGGTLNVQAGSMNVSTLVPSGSPRLTGAGAITVDNLAVPAGGGTVSASSSFTIDQSITGGTFTIPSGASIQIPSASMTGTRMVNKGRLMLGTTSGCGCYLYLNGGAVLDNYGTTNMQDYSYINSQDGAAGNAVINEAGATLTYVGPDSASISATLSGGGTVSAQAGVLDISTLVPSGAPTLSGPGLVVVDNFVSPSGGGTVSASSSFTINSTVTGGTFTVPSGASVQIPNASVTGSRLVNNGHLTLGTSGGCGCYLYLYSGAVLDNFGAITMQDYSYINNGDSVASDGVVNESGATLSYTGPDSSTISSTLSGGGTISAQSGTLHVSTLVPSNIPTLSGPGLVVIDNLMVPSAGGTVSGSSSFTIDSAITGGIFTIPGGASVQIPSASVTGTRLVNKGQLTLGTTGGCGCYLYLYGGAVLDNIGVTTMQDYSYIYSGDSARGNAVINENAAVLAYTGPDSGSISPLVTNSGTIQALGGTLQVSRVKLTATSIIAGPGEIDLQSNFAVPTGAKFASQAVVGISATVALPSTYSFDHVALLKVTGSMSTAGTVTIPAGSAALFDGSAQLQGGLRLANLGTVTVGDSNGCGCTLGLNGGSVIDNAATIIMRPYAYINDSDGNSANTLLNESSGTISYVGGNSAGIGVTLQSSGTVSVATGDLDLYGQTAITGVVAGPGQIDLNGPTTLSSAVTFSGAPAVAVNGTTTVAATLTFAGIASLTVPGKLNGLGTVTLPAVPVTVTGTIAGSGTLTMPTGSASTFSANAVVQSLRVVAKGTTSIGTTNGCGCYLSLTDGAVFDNAGALTMQPYAQILDGDQNANNLVINESTGTIVYVGAGSASITVAVRSSGAITAQAGVLGLSGSNSVTGKIGGPGEVDFSGSTTLSSAVTFVGTPVIGVFGTTTVSSTTAFAGVASLTVAGKVVGLRTVTLPAVQITLTGTLSGTGTVTVPSGATMFADGYAVLQGGLRLVNKGVLTIGDTNGCGCNLSLAGGAVVDNAHTLVLQTYSAINDADGNANNAVVNESTGTITYAGGQSATVAVPVRNAGLIQVQAGLVSLTGNTSITGKLGGPGEIDLNGTTTLSSASTFTSTPMIFINGTTTVSSTTAFAGVSKLTVTGRLNGLGTVTLPAVPIAVTGTLAGSGTVTIPSGALPYFDGYSRLVGGLQLINRASMTVGNPANGCGCTLSLLGGTVLDNYGTITLQNYAQIANGDGNDNDAVINEAAGTIVYTGSGSASIGPSLRNLGVLTAQSGTLTVSELDDLDDGALDEGTVRALGTIQLPQGLSINNASILIGTSGGLVDASTGQSALAGLSANNGSLSTGSSFTSTAPFVNTGSLAVTGGSVEFPTINQTAGRTTVSGGGRLVTSTSCAGALTFTGGTLIVQAGTLCGPVMASAAVSTGTVAAQFSITGSYQNTASTATSVVVSKVGSTASVGHVTVTGAVTVGGTLAVTETSGYDPPVGTVVTVAKGSKLTGTFSSVTSPGLSGKHWVASYTSTSAILTLTAGA